MTIVEKSALVKFSALQMFELVNDIESYPKFLPWCSASRILKRGEDFVEAELLIAKGGFKKASCTVRTIVGGITELIIDDKVLISKKPIPLP